MATDYWNFVEPVWDSLVQWDDVREFTSVFERTAVPSRTLFAAHWLKSEVDNGGFYQFYWNTTGILAPEAADAFVTIGMSASAQVIRQSIAWFPSPYPRDRSRRIALLDRYAAENPGRRHPFDLLDERFYELVESEVGGFVEAANEFARQSA